MTLVNRNLNSLTKDEKLKKDVYNSFIATCRQKVENVRIVSFTGTKYRILNVTYCPLCKSRDKSCRYQCSSCKKYACSQVLPYESVYNPGKQIVCFHCFAAASCFKCKNPTTLCMDCKNTKVCVLCTRTTVCITCNNFRLRIMSKVKNPDIISRKDLDKVIKLLNIKSL